MWRTVRVCCGMWTLDTACCTAAHACTCRLMSHAQVHGHVASHFMHADVACCRKLLPLIFICTGALTSVNCAADRMHAGTHKALPFICVYERISCGCVVRCSATRVQAPRVVAQGDPRHAAGPRLWLSIATAGFGTDRLRNFHGAAGLMMALMNTSLPSWKTCSTQTWMCACAAPIFMHMRWREHSFSRTPLNVRAQYWRGWEACSGLMRRLKCLNAHGQKN